MTRASTNFWYLVLALGLIASIGGLPRLSLNAHYHAYFDESDPLTLLQTRLDQTFTSLDSLVVALRRGNDWNERDFLRAADTISDKLASLPAVADVRSLDRLPWPGGDEALRQAIAEVENRQDTPVLTRADYLGHPRGRLLLSADGTLVAMELTLALADKNEANAVLDAVGAVRAAVDAEIQAEAWPIELLLSGTLALNEAYIATVRKDLTHFVPIMLLAFCVLLWFFFKSVAAVGSLMLIGLLSVLGAFGLAGWLGLPLAAINAFAPIIIWTISIAGGVHIAMHYAAALQQGLDSKSAIVHSLSVNRLPLTLTCVTTALGFLGLSFSPSPPIRVVGYIVAAGVLISYLLIRILLPWLLRRSSAIGAADFHRRLPLPRLVRWSQANRWRILTATILIAGVSVLLIPRNEINDNVFRYFPAGHAFRADTRQIDEQLGGINQLQYQLGSGEAYGIFERPYVDTLGRVQSWLESHASVKQFATVNDWLAWRMQREGRSLDELLAGSARLARQAGSADEQFRREVDAQFSASRILVYLPQESARELIEFDREFKAWFKANGGGLSLLGGAGPSLSFAHLGLRNARGMLISLSVALIAIALLTGLLLRSLRVAGVALICNLIPILLVYAVWAVTNGTISLGSAVVIGMIMGILVDDSIYLLCQYARGRDAGTANPAGGAVTTVGPALVITSITLCVGLSVGLLSNFQPIATMSGLSVAVIAIALIADILLLPILLHRRREAASHSEGME